MTPCEREQKFWEELKLNLTDDQNTNLMQQGEPSKHLHATVTVLPSSQPSSLVRLPIELLWIIFELSIVKPFQRDPFEFGYIDARAPTKLVQICSHWRSVAIRNPALWSSIHLRRITRRSIYGVRLWLIRSRGHRLSLRYNPDVIRKYDSGMEEIMTLYFDNRHRWREISFDLSSITDSMRHLWISTRSSDDPEHQTWSINSSLQNQCATYMDAPRAMIQDPQIKTPWGQLTTASLTEVDTKSLWSVLTHCCSLQSLAVFLSPIGVTGLRHHLPPITLPSLRRLRMHIPTELKASTVFALLTTPELRELYFSQFEHENPQPEAFHDFLSRSKCSLERLTVSDSMLAERDFIAYIDSPMLSKVTHVYLYGTFTCELLKALALNELWMRWHRYQEMEDDFENSACIGSHILPSLESLRLGVFNLFGSHPAICRHWERTNQSLASRSYAVKKGVYLKKTLASGSIKKVKLDVDDFFNRDTAINTEN
ncbi:hypothetical protein AX16_000703 [Volvariella volvacea WC 439]|nr:hypothetical protein AX16_000703 [Volvariella volvacea WC 439]